MNAPYDWEANRQSASTCEGLASEQGKGCLCPTHPSHTPCAGGRKQLGPVAGPIVRWLFLNAENADAGAGRGGFLIP